MILYIVILTIMSVSGQFVIVSESTVIIKIRLPKQTTNLKSMFTQVICWFVQIKYNTKSGC